MPAAKHDIQSKLPGGISAVIVHTIIYCGNVPSIHYLLCFYMVLGKSLFVYFSAHSITFLCIVLMMQCLSNFPNSLVGFTRQCRKSAWQ